jgi:hypothetical protein
MNPSTFKTFVLHPSTLETDLAQKNETSSNFLKIILYLMVPNLELIINSYMYFF